MNNTRKLSDFGYREIDMAAELLNAYKQNKSILGDGVEVEFNLMSGNVFLVDEDCNVAMMNEDNLELWYFCPYCGHEGFLEDMIHDPKNSECTRYLREIGALPEEELGKVLEEHNLTD